MPTQTQRWGFALVLVFSFLFLSFQPQVAFAQREFQPGLSINTGEATEGYILFAPQQRKRTYLIDHDGQLIHQWESDFKPGRSFYLLENGHLLLTEAGPLTAEVGRDKGGYVTEYDWDGNVVWRLEYFSDTYHAHHDIEPLPNGNILIIAWDVIPPDEVVAAGRMPDRLPRPINTLPTEIPEEPLPLYPDKIVEYDPSTREFVWEWRVWDHLIQDYDPSLPNYGDPSENPHRIDLNYIGEGDGYSEDWNHLNAVAYNADLDQIIMSVRAFSEIWVIDHSTTTEEAASSTGGNAGMGGDLLYRWGNPATYGMGTEDDRIIIRQHDAQWIEPGLQGAGNIIVFDNGNEGMRPYSRATEFVPPLNSDGTYRIGEDGIFGPDAPTWTYQADPPESFYSPYLSSVQRLPSGNTFIAEGQTGRMFEVTPDGEIVWEYVNPDDEFAEGDDYLNQIFRAKWYPTNFVGFEGRDLSPKGLLSERDDLPSPLG